MKLSAALFLFLFTVNFISVSSEAQVQEVVELTTTASSEKESTSAAKQDIFEKAVEDTSVQYIKEILGETKFEKNKDTIKNKIIRNSGKYILFMKGGTPRKNAGLTEMDVTLKISLKSLEALLLNEGLLYKMEGPPRALPMIGIIDRVNSRSYSWWSAQSTEDKAFLSQQIQVLHGKLRDQLRPRGFYAFDPTFVPTYLLAPEVFQSENPPTEDFLFLAEFLQSQIVIKGYVLLKPSERSQSYKIDVKLMALHSANGRVVGEVIRSYETASGTFAVVVSEKLSEVGDQIAEDLAVQLHDAWKSGTFGASLIQLSLLGDLDYQQLNQLKRLILTQVKDVKTLKERYFSPGRVTFELDSSVNARQLAEAFKSKDFPRFRVEVAEVRSDGLDLKVKTQ